MAYSAHKTAMPPPPSPSPFSRLPTPSNSNFNRPHASRSVSSSVYGSSHPSPSRPTLAPHASSYDSFAPQPCPTPTAKTPGLGLHRSASTVNSSHKRQSSIAERAKLFEKVDDGMRSPSTSAGFGLGVSASNLRVPASGHKREPLSANVDAMSPISNRMSSRPASYVESGNNGQELFGDMKIQVSGLRRPSQPLNILSEGLGNRQPQEYESQASPAPMRKSLGLLNEPSPNPSQLMENIKRDDSQLMPPPPPSLIRRFSVSSPTRQNPVPVEATVQVPLKPPTPPSQVPTPSPRKGTHIRAQSHVVGPSSKPPPRASSTRPMDARPTSTAGRKAAGAGIARPPSTLHAIPSARPRAVSHNAAEPRRIATPANDLPLPKGSRQASGRVIAPPRPTSTRPNEPVVPHSTATRRALPNSNRPRPASSHIAPPPSISSKGSDTESSIRSESVASTTSNTSSVRSDLTTRPKTANRPTPVYKPVQEPPTSPVRSHRKTTSTIAAAKPSRPNFNTYKVEYQHATPTPKPSSASLIHQNPHPTAPAVQSAEMLHAQTRLLQLSILHAKGLESSAAFQKSAHDKLYKRFSEIRDKNLLVSASYRREQELVDLHALSLILKKPGVVNTASGHKLSGGPEEAIQSLSEHLSKVLGWFAEGQYEGEYTQMIRVFEEWISLPDEHERKIDGLGVDFARDILRVKRKMEMALRSLEGWVTLVAEGEKGEDGAEIAGLKSSLGRVLNVAVGRLRLGLVELTSIQNLEKTIVATMRKDLKRNLAEMVEARREVDLVEQKKELAAWQPAWS